MVDSNFGPYSQGDMAMFLMKLLTPALKKKIQAKPKKFWNWTMSDRVHFVSEALDEIMNDPRNAILKNVIENTPYANSHGLAHMPYYQLASKLRNVV